MGAQRTALVGVFYGSVLAGGIAAAACELAPSRAKTDEAPLPTIQTTAPLEGTGLPRAVRTAGGDAHLDVKVIDAALVDVGPSGQADTPSAPASSTTPIPLQSVAEETAAETAKAAATEPEQTPLLAPMASIGTAGRAADGGDQTADKVANAQSASAPLPDPPPLATKGGPLVTLFGSARVEDHVKPIVRPVETPNECLVAEICIDDYLWSLYEVAPKVDTNKVTERIKAIVKKKGKTRTIIKTVARYVVGDFTWKDPIAAQRGGMSVKDYVIGGMDRSFKLKLYRALHAMEAAGFMPGITSAFRDDYRQSLASGKKAASDSSYHGGSRRGGYGHGLAADLVSLKGETRLERYVSSKELWKWIDAHEKELGVGRPYLDRDAPHVAPIDGKEYADKRGARARIARSIMKSRRATASATHRVTRPATKTKSVTVGSI
jgi:hypothetical protein